MAPKNAAGPFGGLPMLPPAGETWHWLAADTGTVRKCALKDTGPKGPHHTFHYAVRVDGPAELAGWASVRAEVRHRSVHAEVAYRLWAPPHDPKGKAGLCGHGVDGASAEALAAALVCHHLCAALVARLQEEWAAR